MGKSVEMMNLAGDFFRNAKILKASASFANLENLFQKQLSGIMQNARIAGFLPAASKGVKTTSNRFKSYFLINKLCSLVEQ